MAKTNRSGWTQWYELSGGITPKSKVVLTKITDEFRLLQKKSNSLTLQRRAAAGALVGVAAVDATEPKEDEGLNFAQQSSERLEKFAIMAESFAET